MKRSDIQPGMPAVLTCNGVSVHAIVVCAAQGPFWRVRLQDGTERSDVLSMDLEKRRLPSARAKAPDGVVGLRDIMKSYEQIAGRGYSRSELIEFVKRAEGKR